MLRGVKEGRGGKDGREFSSFLYKQDTVCIVSSVKNKSKMDLKESNVDYKHNYHINNDSL